MKAGLRTASFLRSLFLAIPAAVLLALAIFFPAQAMFIQAPDVPVERLLKNTAAYLQEHPQDPQGYFVQARLHSLAFALKTQALPAFDAEGEGAKKLPRVDEIALRNRDPQAPATNPPKEALDQHLREALKNFRQAIEIDAKRALFHLGLAYTLETGAAQAQAAPPGFPEAGPPSPAEKEQCERLVKKLGDQAPAARQAAHEELRALGAKALPILLQHLRDTDLEAASRARQLLAAHWKDQALAAYLRAYRLSIAEDLKITHKPAEGMRGLVAYEAGQACLRLLKERAPSEAEKKTAEELEKNLKALDGKPFGPITPVIFSLEEKSTARLGGLLAQNKSAIFDLDGDGEAEAWPWVKPETCLLVWDPRSSGKIASGRQLFGSVTWWIFWNNGYQALDALDDNRDGELSGEELRGLAVWRDQNANGVSDAGEVVPAGALGIEALSVRVTHHDGVSPASARGVRMRDGTTRPTYDWIVEPGIQGSQARTLSQSK